MKYSAYVVEEVGALKFEGSIKELDTNDLPAGEVLIKVEYSSLNYKDALSASGNKGVTRNFPHTPGIDAAGIITESSSDKYKVGQEVIVIGYDLGMNTSGAFGGYIRVPAAWVIPRTNNITSKTSMAWGTAGFTSALCIEKLILSGIKANDGPVVVTGGTGGVGSVAIKLLSKLGFEVHAVTSKPEATEFLERLGASTVIMLSDFIDDSSKPMLKPLYSAGIDVAGGTVLTSMLKKINYQGVVACCGLVDSIALQTTVLPFILRGITLAGVDSVELPLEKKISVWDKISTDWSLDDIEGNAIEISLAQLQDSLDLILNGHAKGRFILKHEN